SSRRRTFPDLLRVGSGHLLQFAGLGAVIARQLAERFAIERRADDLLERLDSVVARKAGGEAEVVGLFTNAEKVQPGLLADEAEADAGIGPAAANGFSDAAVVGGKAARGRLTATQQFIKALTCSGPVFAADPAQVGMHSG